jgi:hypothetical protein
MTIFIAHAAPDREVAEALEKFLERRANFVELEDGERAMRPLGIMDACIILVSKDFVFSPQRLRFEKRALDAWAEGKLIVVKLDHNFAPVGLRDLPFIDASFEAQRDPFTWNKVADEVREKTRPQAPSMSQSQSAPAPGAPPSAGAPPLAKRSRKQDSDDSFGAPQSSKKGGGGVAFAILSILLSLPGIFALATSAAIWLANRIGPEPGTFADMVEGIDAFGMRFGLPAGITPILFAAAIALTIGLFVFRIGALIARSFRRDEDSEGAPMAEEAEAAAPDAVGGVAEAPEGVFISYARANATLVLPVVEGVKKERKVWLDQNEIGLGDGWAGEIVRAIKTAHDVVVMCSAAAFESDHVKREVYLADRYKKRLLPVFIEDAQPPEDFEYFFAGVQFLKLHETPEAERTGAVLKALGAPA